MCSEIELVSELKTAHHFLLFLFFDTHSKSHFQCGHYLYLKLTKILRKTD